MGILDTFYILFETDADKADQAVKALRASAKETAGEVDKSVKGAKELAPAIKAADNETGRLAGSFRAVGGAILAAGAVLVAGITVAATRRMGEIDALTKVADRLGDSVDKVDAWRKAVKAAGGELDAAEGALESYGQTLAKINAGIGKQQGKALAGLGLSATDGDGNLKTARQGLLELAGALEGLERQKQLAKIRSLGIVDQGTIALLLQGRAAIEAQTEAQRRNGVITQQQAEAVRKYKDSADGVKAVLDGWAGALLSRVLPALTALNKALEWGGKWLSNNSTFTMAFLGALGVITAFLLATYIPAWWAAAAAVLAATWPIVAIAAAVVALALAFALAYEDVQAFMNGQKSLIGDLMERYPAFARVVRALGVVFRALASVAAAVFRAVMDAGRRLFSGLVSFARGFYAIAAPIFGLFHDVMVAIWGAISRAVMDRIRPWLPLIRIVFDAMSVGVRAVGRVFQDVFAAIGRWWDKTFGGIVQGLNTVVNGARRLLGMEVSDNADAAARGVRAGQGQFAAAGSSPLNTSTSFSITNRGAAPRIDARSFSIGEVNVNAPGADAAGVASGVRGALDGEFRSASSSFDDGVER